MKEKQFKCSKCGQPIEKEEGGLDYNRIARILGASNVEHVKCPIDRFEEINLYNYRPCVCGHSYKIHNNGKECLEPNHFRDERYCNCEEFKPDDRYRLIKTDNGYMWGY